MKKEIASQNTKADAETIDKLVSVNRVAKVVKGGRRFSFSASVIVGDGHGSVGFGFGKAKEVPDAVSKATSQAKRNMHRIPLKDSRTLFYDVTGRSGAGKVLIRSAPAGTGIIAGGPMRSVFEALGVHDVVAKSHGSKNPTNMVLATLQALRSIQSPSYVKKRLQSIG